MARSFNFTVNFFLIFDLNKNRTMSSGMIYDRRSFISAASLTLAASGLTLSGFSQSESETTKRTGTGSIERA